MSPRVFLAATSLFAGSLAAGADSFCIGGQVVNGSTGEPLARSAVTLPQSAALTDAAGTFHFCGLAPGAYYANAEKPGFAASGLLVPVGPSREDVILRLLPLGVIHGAVLDGDNHPLENALIQVLSTTTEAGRRKVRVEATVATDDRGDYRLPNLKPGRYYLRAAGWQGPPADAKDAAPHQTFPPTYYGGSNEISSATLLSVEPGQQVTADFTLRMEPAYAVRGTIEGYSALLEMTVELVRPEEGLSTGPVTFNPQNGAFQANNVVPGSYLLRATQGEGDQRVRGELPVEIGAADVNDLVVPMSIPVTVSGVVRTTASSDSKPASPNCSIELSSAGMLVSSETLQTSTGDNGAAALMAAAVVTPGETPDQAVAPANNEENNGDFEIQGVMPGRYRLRMDCAGGYVASVRSGNADLMSHPEFVVSPGVNPPIEAVVNTDGATIDVVTPKDDEGLSAWLALLPDSGSELHTKFTILKGKTTFSGVAPGDYHAYAWTGSPYAFEYADPGARQMWANRAVGVHVAERDHVSITAKIAPGDAQ